MNTENFVAEIISFLELSGMELIRIFNSLIFTGVFSGKLGSVSIFLITGIITLMLLLLLK